MIHNFKLNYEKTVYVNKITDVIIICPEHGEFSKKPKDHFKIKTGGCVACKEIQFCSNVVFDRKFRFNEFHDITVKFVIAMLVEIFTQSYHVIVFIEH